MATINDLPHIYEIEEMLSFCKRYEHLYIYGAGEKQEYLLKFLDICNIKIDGYVVSWFSSQELKYRQIPIILADDVIKQENTGIILGLPDRYYGKIIPWFREQGFSDYYVMSEYSKDSIAQKLTPPYGDKVFFEVSLAFHCNLDCQMCDHFSQLSDKRFLDVDSYERDMKHLGELFEHKLANITLLGGEPLLHKEIIRMIEISRREFPHAGIEILTNGLLLLKLEHSENGNLWQACKDNSVRITITRYPIKIDYDAITKLAEKYCVSLKISSDIISAVEETSIKISDKHPFDLTGGQQIYEALSCFYFNRCRVLKDGRLYTCHIAANADIFNSYFNQSLTVSEDDSIDIYKAQSGDEIAEFLSKPIPFCRYCDIKNRKKHSPWKRSTKKIEEYTNE